MTLCDYCRKEIESETLGKAGTIITGGLYEVKSSPIALPFDCLRCGGKYCSAHRLPENHECSTQNFWKSNKSSASKVTIPHVNKYVLPNIVLNNSTNIIIIISLLIGFGILFYIISGK